MSLVEQFYRLQERIRFVQSRERERDTIPPDLVEVDRAYREKVETLERIRARLVEAERERRRADAELSDLTEKQKKYQTQLRNVQSSREYSAVLNEIDGVERLIRGTKPPPRPRRGDRVGRKDIAAREQNLPRETEEHEDRLKDWRSVQRSINEELTSAQEEIGKLEAEISLGIARSSAASSRRRGGWPWQSLRGALAPPAT